MWTLRNIIWTPCLLIGLGSALMLSACELGADTNDTEIGIDDHGKKDRKRVRPTAIPDRLVVGVPASGVELGMGWDSARGEVVPNNCLNFAPVRSTGQSIDMNMSKVSDQSELMEKMNVSASVAVKSIVASGSAKASLAKETKMTSNSTTLLLKASVDNSALTIGPPGLQSPARSAYPKVVPTNSNRQDNYDYQSGIVGFTKEIKSYTKSPEQFRRACGDYFVASIQSGAELYAVFSISSTSKEQRVRKSAEVQGNYGIVSGQAKASSDKSSKSSNAKTEVHFMQIGGGGEDGIIPISEEHLAAKLATLPKEASKSPQFHTMEIRSYREIPGSEKLLYASTEGGFETVADYYWFLTSFAQDIEELISGGIVDEIDTKGLSGAKLTEAQTYNEAAKAAKMLNPGIGLQGQDLIDLKTQVIEVQRALADIMEAYLDDEMPDLETVETAKVDWFKHSAANDVFNLDFSFIPGLITKTDAANKKLCGPTGWFGCFVDELETSVPYGNPNTLRLLLPVRIEDAGGLESVASLKIFSAWYHIQQQSDRTCARDPQDNQCMTPAELKALEDYIPVNE